MFGRNPTSTMNRYAILVHHNILKDRDRIPHSEKELALGVPKAQPDHFPYEFYLLI
jgi:hypothetical protein